MPVNRAEERLLQVSGLSKRFVIDGSLFDLLKKTPPAEVQALNQLEFSVSAGETLGILGESGSGKSTLARILMGIYAADAGEARLNGKSIFTAYCGSTAERLQMLKSMQMIFQDPYGSLDPRMTVRQIISEPLKIHGMLNGDSEALLVKTLEEVGLGADSLERYPAEFSGGQRQRIGICRAVILNPDLIIADEAVSALDVSVQAQILELLCRLRRERGLAMIFISHDVAVVRQISDRIILLYRGNLVEEMSADCLLTDSAHPYTQELLDSAKFLREGATIEASPQQVNRALQGGCCYRQICRYAFDRCQEKPPAFALHPGHLVSCWKYR